MTYQGSLDLHMNSELQYYYSVSVPFPADIAQGDDDAPASSNRFRFKRQVEGEEGVNQDGTAATDDGTVATGDGQAATDEATDDGQAAPDEAQGGETVDPALPPASSVTTDLDTNDVEEDPVDNSDVDDEVADGGEVAVDIDPGTEETEAGTSDDTPDNSFSTDHSDGLTVSCSESLTLETFYALLKPKNS